MSMDNSNALSAMERRHGGYNPMHASSAFTVTMTGNTMQHSAVTMCKRIILGEKDVATVKSEIHDMLDSYDNQRITFRQYRCVLPLW